MKISDKQYASALYESAKGKSQKEINSAISNFVKILAKNNKIKNVSSIINKFREIWNKKEGIVEAEVATSRKLESSQVHKVESFIKEKYRAEKVEIIEKIDSNIKGGIIVRVGDEVMDGSVSRSLKELKNKLAS